MSRVSRYVHYLGIALAAIGAMHLAGWWGTLIVLGALFVLNAMQWEIEDRLRGRVQSEPVRRQQVFVDGRWRDL